jgi:hypothetical protein
MPRGLKNDPQIWTLARDLGLRVKDDPLAEILAYCSKWARDLFSEFRCNSLSDLLEYAADRLSTVFREVHTDEELAEIKDQYLKRGEKEFALVDQEFDSGVLAITFRLLTPRKGERQFISIIDCRGKKAYRSYYSKWHELAHLITLTDQRRFKFCRTHSIPTKTDPEEALMEKIAGHIGYLPDLVRPHAKGAISFDKIAAVREVLCPESSIYASILGITKSWPTACILIEAGLEYKKREKEKLDQPGFDFVAQPKPKLRIISITSSSDAEEFAGLLHPKMRVPKRSVIHRVFTEDLMFVDSASENLNWWETSTDGHLPLWAYAVHAQKQGDMVQALLIPERRT